MERRGTHFGVDGGELGKIFKDLDQFRVISDMSKEGIAEPLAVKEQVIKSAAEAACMLLRIDDVIASSRSPSGTAGANQVGMGM